MVIMDDITVNSDLLKCSSKYYLDNVLVKKNKLR